jgi:hypothetical protein
MNHPALIRMPRIAAVALLLMGTAAFAQPGPPAGDQGGPPGNEAGPTFNPGGPGGPGIPGGPGGMGEFGPPGGVVPGELPRPGVVLPGVLQRVLNLTDAQKQQVEALQKEVDARLATILTADQLKTLKSMGPPPPPSTHPGLGPGHGPPGGEIQGVPPVGAPPGN